MGGWVSPEPVESISCSCSGDSSKEWSVCRDLLYAGHKKQRAASYSVRHKQPTCTTTRFQLWNHPGGSSVPQPLNIVPPTSFLDCTINIWKEWMADADFLLRALSRFSSVGHAIHPECWLSHSHDWRGRRRLTPCSLDSFSLVYFTVLAFQFNRTYNKASSCRFHSLPHSAVKLPLCSRNDLHFFHRLLREGGREG